MAKNTKCLITKSVDAVCKHTPNWTWHKQLLCTNVISACLSPFRTLFLSAHCALSQFRSFFIHTGVPFKKSCLSQHICCVCVLVRHSSHACLLLACLFTLFLWHFWLIHENERHKTSPNGLDARDMFTRSYIKLLIGFIFISMARGALASIDAIRRCAFCWRRPVWFMSSIDCHIAHCSSHYTLALLNIYFAFIGRTQKMCIEWKLHLAFFLGIDNVVLRLHFLYVNKFCICPPFITFYFLFHQPEQNKSYMEHTRFAMVLSAINIQIFLTRNMIEHILLFYDMCCDRTPFYCVCIAHGSDGKYLIL